MRVWKKSQNLPGLAVSRSIGDKVAAEIGVIGIPDIFEIQLKPNDKMVVLGSDGVWTVLTNEEVIEIVGHHIHTHDAEKACEEVIEAALNSWNKRGNVTDDITVIVIYL